jgi:chromosome segregation protein
LQNKTEQKEKDHDEELLNIDIIVAENEKLKNEILILEEKIKTNEEKMKMNLSAKEDEIKILNQDLEFKKKNLSKVNEEKNKEINLLKNEITKCNKDINNLIKKNEIIQREDEEIKVKNNILQNKLDKKTKELKEINESVKTLIENKENLIKQYEDKIEDINKDKNKLIEQNHELLDKIKNINTNNLGDILNEEDENSKDENENQNNYENENLLLITEIKSLKEQLENQAHDLVSLNAMEKEVSRLKSENEKLIEDNKQLKNRINKQKYDKEADNLMNTIQNRYNILRASSKNRLSLNNLKDITIDNKAFYEKQIEAIKKMKESEKKIMLDEIDKLKGDIAILKVKYLNQDLENEILLVKYKNYLKIIGEECKKRGIRFNLKL